MTALSLSLWSLLGLCLIFGAAYLLARRIDNYGIVDIAWSYAFGLLAAVHAILGAGWWGRRLAVLCAVGLWSTRLGTHLLVRIKAKHPEEDGRYRQLRLDWKERFAPTMAGFFQLQAVSVVLLGIPFACACGEAAVGFRPLELAGFALWIVALLGEATADHQLRLFKKTPEGRTGVCDRGLWRYSRHPNYFFEWLIWVSYFLIGLGSPWGYWGALGPICILYLLLRVTGIPATEEQAIRSKGDLYRRYQARTSAFIPLPPKKTLS